ncbi:helix-turn-helix domain-containing protein [Pseudoalteromonas sp. GB56]
MSLGNAIKNLRQNYQLSQPELAVRAGIEQSYLSKIENDKSMPSEDIFERLLSALDLTVEQFMESVGHHIDSSQLLQITQTKRYVGQQHRLVQQRQNLLQIFAIVLIAFGCALFYCAHTTLLFPERQYVYESEGVIKDSEPDNFFSIRRLSSTDTKIFDELVAKMHQRTKKEYIYSYDMLGLQFERQEEGGRRIYVYNTNIEHPRVINGVLTFVAIFALVIGSLLLVRSFPWLRSRKKPTN